MNDRQTLVSEPGFPVAALLFAIVAAGLLAGGLGTDNLHLVLAALPAAALAAGLGFVRGPHVCGELAESGLLLSQPPLEIPYEAMQSLTLAGVPQALGAGSLKRGSLMIAHRAGVLEIPARNGVAAVELYRFLLGKIPASGSRDVNPLLAERLRAEEATFGADRVWSYSARRRLGRRPSTVRTQVCCALLAVAGFAWILTAALAGGKNKLRQEDLSAWIGFGIVLLVGSLLGWLIAWAQQRHPDANLKKWREASLIVSPSGIAMVQSDVQGQLRWDELRDVVVNKRPRGFATGYASPTGIHLLVEGATIRIGDIYDRPLALIEAQIRRYWQGK